MLCYLNPKKWEFLYIECKYSIFRWDSYPIERGECKSSLKNMKAIHQFLESNQYILTIQRNDIEGGLTVHN